MNQSLENIRWYEKYTVLFKDWKSLFTSPGGKASRYIISIPYETESGDVISYQRSKTRSRQPSRGARFVNASSTLIW